MMLHRRRLLAAAMATPMIARGETWAPSGTVRLVVPYPPGGSTDLLARALAPGLQARLGQAVVVENRPGASGNIAMGQVANAAPDGLTIAMAPASNLVTNQFLFTLGFDPVAAFAPVVLLAAAHNILVVAATHPAHDMRALVAWARARDTVTYATPAVGSAAHLGMEALARAAGFSATHVPYRGIPQALTDVARAEVSMMLAHDGTARPLVESGRLRALGVASLRRSPGSVDVPTIAEQGFPGFQAMSWFGFVVPAATPAPIVARLNAEANALLATEEVAAIYAAQGAERLGGSPQDFARHIRTEAARWGEVIRVAGIRMP
jgi:tripartite-type tricarboxylate transporter receptor subunit TctC